MYDFLLNEANENSLLTKIPPSVKQLVTFISPYLNKLVSDIPKLYIAGSYSFEGVVLVGAVGLIKTVIKKISGIKKESFLLEEGFILSNLLPYLLKIFVALSLFVGLAFIIFFSVCYKAKSVKELEQNFIYKRLFTASRDLLIRLRDFYRNKVGKLADQHGEEAKPDRNKINLLITNLAKIDKIMVNVTDFWKIVNQAKVSYKDKNPIMKYLLTLGQVIKSKDSLKAIWAVIYVPIVALSSYLKIKLPEQLQKMKDGIEKRKQAKQKPKT